MNKASIQKTFDTSRLDLFVVALVLLLTTLPAISGGYHSLSSIRLQAEAFVMDYSYASPYPPRFSAGKLDSRLRLQACPEALQVEFAHRDKIYGNTALTIRCPVGAAWKIHLPVTIELYDDVVVAAKPLLKGQFIDGSALRLEKRDVTRLKNGYYRENSALEQLQAKRNLERGTVLSPRNLAPRLMVRSGQQVTLVLNYRGLQVKSTGKALQSASLGDVIKVRNSQTHKIVEGVVRGAGLVQVTI